MVTWGPVETARERVMVYGDMGVGKTKAALDIARRLVGTEARMFVVDCDRSWERMVPKEWQHTVQVHQVRGWEQEARALEACLKEASRDDWLVVDSSSRMWDDVARWYIRKVHGEDLPEFMVQHRLQQIQSGKKATAGQDAVLIEWNYINPVWHGTVTEPLIWAPCHVFVTAEAGEMRTDGRDSKQVQRQYMNAGWKPRTQKGLGFAMHTVLYFDKSSNGEYRMMTVKERQDSRGDRGRFDREPWTDFFGSYLRGCAGWKPKTSPKS